MRPHQWPGEAAWTWPRDRVGLAVNLSEDGIFSCYCYQDISTWYIPCRRISSCPRPRACASHWPGCQSCYPPWTPISHGESEIHVTLQIDSFIKYRNIYLDVSSPRLVCEVLGGVDLALCTPLQFPVLDPLVSAARLVEIEIKLNIFTRFPPYLVRMVVKRPDPWLSIPLELSTFNLKGNLL